MGNGRPPTITLDSEWRAVASLTTTLLGSPFRPWPFVVSDGDRARAARAGREARAEAATRLEAVAARGLRFVDRVLFQETRAPCFAVGTFRDQVFPAMPDHFARHPITLIDTRYPRHDLEAGLSELGYRVVRNGLDIREPSLLPDTAEDDALASFCIWVYQDLSRRPLGEHDPRFVMRALELVYAAEAALKDGAALDACYGMIGDLADYDPGRGRQITQVEELTLRTARGARTFLDMKDRMPPPKPEPEEPPIDETDADHVASSFNPQGRGPPPIPRPQRPRHPWPAPSTASGSPHDPAWPSSSQASTSADRSAPGRRTAASS